MADILIVDDDPDVAAPLGQFLELEGHTVRMATDGKDGLRKIADRLPDLILLDVEMPEMNGPDMSRAVVLRDAGQECIPVVLISGVPDLRDIARAVGTPYFLAKPYRFSQIGLLLNKALIEKTAPAPGKASS